MKKLKLVWVLGVITLLISSYYAFNGRQEESKTTISYYVNEALNIEKYEWFGDGKYLALELDKDGAVFDQGHRYLMSFENKVRKDENYANNPPIEADESYKLIVYDIQTPELTKKTIDVYSSLRAYNRKHNVNYGLKAMPSLVHHEGKDYARLRMYKVHSVENEDQKENNDAPGLDTEEYIFTIDLETEELIARPSGFPTSPNGLYPYPLIVDGIDFENTDAFKDNGLYWNSSPQAISPFYGDEYYDFLHYEKISETNFSTLYPSISERLSGTQTHLLAIRDKVSEEEWFNTTLYWLAPAGQEVLEVYAEDSSTKERTLITSYAEYQSWKIEHPDEYYR